MSSTSRGGKQPGGANQERKTKGDSKRHQGSKGRRTCPVGLATLSHRVGPCGSLPPLESRGKEKVDRTGSPRWTLGNRPNGDCDLCWCRVDESLGRPSQPPGPGGRSHGKVQREKGKAAKWDKVERYALKSSVVEGQSRLGGGRKASWEEGFDLGG